MHVVRLHGKDSREIVSQLDVFEVCLVKKIAIETGVRVLPATDCRLEESTKVFHWECPVRPNGPGSDDAISDVEKSMYGQRTC